jgi:hypothetical protein
MMPFDRELVNVLVNKSEQQNKDRPTVRHQPANRGLPRTTIPGGVHGPRRASRL